METQIVHRLIRKVTKRLNLKLLVAGAIFLYSCNGKTVDQSDLGTLTETPEFISGPIHLEFEKIIENRRDIFLSEFVSKIDYIKLETNPAYLIGDKYVQVSLTDSLIIINEHGKPVGLFSKSGEFIREIGHIGKGPGEYDFDTHFRLDEENRQLYVWNAMRRSIMVFDFMGQFLNEFKPECKPNGFGYTGNNVFVTTQFNIRYADSILPKFIVFNEKGETINRAYAYSKDPARLGGGIAIMLPSYYEAPGGVVINTYENDTLFKAFPNGDLLPAITWDAGRLRVPYDILLEFERYMREKERYITGIEGLESETYWLFSYHYQGKFNMALFNKNDESFTVVLNPDDELKGVINDIDGGPSFWPRYNGTGGKIFVDILYPTQLKRWNDEGRFNRDDVLFPEKQAKFREIAKNIDLDDNPVLMIVHLK